MRLLLSGSLVLTAFNSVESEARSLQSGASMLGRHDRLRCLSPSRDSGKPLMKWAIVSIERSLTASSARQYRFGRQTAAAAESRGLQSRLFQGVRCAARFRRRDSVGERTEGWPHRGAHRRSNPGQAEASELLLEAIDPTGTKRSSCKHFNMQANSSSTVISPPPSCQDLQNALGQTSRRARGATGRPVASCPEPRGPVLRVPRQKLS